MLERLFYNHLDAPFKYDSREQFDHDGQGEVVNIAPIQPKMLEQQLRR